MHPNLLLSGYAVNQNQLPIEPTIRGVFTEGGERLHSIDANGQVANR